MKLPFDFATKLLLRLVLPGALLTAICWPLLMATCDWLGIVPKMEAIIPVAVLIFGWLVLLLDMPLYMIAEGRRFWPEPVRAWGVRREAMRLSRLESKRAVLPADSPRRTELSLEIRKFPLTPAGDPQARFPTRLGNLINASESYPDRKYGLDGVFAWYRLWVVLDKDLRGELDDQQAIVDSALYASSAAVLAAALCLVYGAIAWISPPVLPTLPSIPALLVLAAGAAIASRLLYRAALVAQAQYGEIFGALFDQHLDKLQFGDAIEQLAETMSEPDLKTRAQRERARAAVRFLKWHKYRKAGTTQNLDVRDW